MAILDAHPFPHILDTIVNYAPFTSLLVLRRVSHELKTIADYRLRHHIVIVHCPPPNETGMILRSALGGRLPLDPRLIKFVEKLGELKVRFEKVSELSLPEPAHNWKWDAGDFETIYPDNSSAIGNDSPKLRNRSQILARLARLWAVYQLARTALADVRVVDLHLDDDGCYPSGSCAHILKIITKARSLNNPEEGSSHRRPIVFRSKIVPRSEWPNELVFRCTTARYPGSHITAAAQTHSIHHIFANVNPLEPITRRRFYNDSREDDPSLDHMTIIVGAIPNDSGHPGCDFPPDYRLPRDYHIGLRGPSKQPFLRTRYFFQNTIARHLGLTPVERPRPPSYSETVENHPTDDALYLASVACGFKGLSGPIPVTIVGAPLPPDGDTAVARYPSLEGHDLEYLTHEEYLTRVGAYRYSINVLEW